MAVPNDLDRCEFRYADDRRCREFRVTPEARFCYTHQEAADRAAQREKDSRAAKEPLTELVSEGLFDTATSVTELLRLVFQLSVEGAISAREAAVYTQMIRLLYKAAPAMADEYPPLSPELLAAVKQRKQSAPLSPAAPQAQQDTAAASAARGNGREVPAAEPAPRKLSVARG